jgi:23S rRNA (cytidine1920-2'-O)/16S rRNA (cytidine1409-2'-O)-methyltransferase
VLPSVAPITKPGADVLILIKPQFELEKRQVGKGGIVRNAALQEKAVADVTAAASALGFEIQGMRPSRITGTEGNQEFFLHVRRSE